MLQLLNYYMKCSETSSKVIIGTQNISWSLSYAAYNNSLSYGKNKEIKKKKRIFDAVHYG